MVSNLSRLTAELLVVKSEGRPAHYSPEDLAERVELANAISADSLVRVVEILWELRARTRATENDQRSSMEMAFTLIANAVRPRTQEAVSILPCVEKSDPEPERLTFADMVSLYAPPQER